VGAQPGEAGGFKEVIVALQGSDVFRWMKYEGGGHRVQRVPATESQGRIHTSAATVAVLPEAEEYEVELKAEELHIEACRSQGPGGQSVNTTDSAVRVVHLPTGISVHMQDEKSQHKNKAKALRVLRSRLYEYYQSQIDAERDEARRTQTGSGDRSQRVRTYNFPQNRVTDHRLGQNFPLEKVIDGDLGPLLTALEEWGRNEELNAATKDASS
jgi:peptide chain release factor 1